MKTLAGMNQEGFATLGTLRPRRKARRLSDEEKSRRTSEGRRRLGRCPAPSPPREWLGGHRPGETGVLRVADTAWWGGGRIHAGL